MAIINQVGNALTGATGSGSFVGANSATLITPNIGAATGTSINLGSTTTINGFINDNTFATASATTGATSSSVKAYTDAHAAASTITAWVAYTPTFTGFGTAASVEFWSRRVGDVLQIRGRFTSGTPTTTEARITLGYAGTNANVNSSGTVITSIQVAGPIAYSATGATNYIGLIESNVGYFTMGIQSAGRAGLSKVNGDTIVLSGQTLSFFLKIPVTTWP